MKFAITGGTGFIGSNFVNRLLREHHEVTVFDSKTKDEAHRLQFCDMDKIEYHTTNFDIEYLVKKLKNFDVVTHFYTSANTALGYKQTDVDLKKGTIVTYNILEAMRINKIKKIIFSSAPAVYGMPIKIPTPEDTGMLLPVSLYGAAKLASEGLISAFCHLFGMKTWIFRFGNVVGPNMTKGVIVDFIKKLIHDPHALKIMGDGTQQKDVIFIDDCIDGILFALTHSNDTINLFNLSSGTTITINEIAKIVQQEMRLCDVKIIHGKRNVGWEGDVSTINYDISKIKKLGWNPKYSANEAIQMSTRTLVNYIK